MICVCETESNIYINRDIGTRKISFFLLKYWYYSERNQPRFHRIAFYLGILNLRLSLFIHIFSSPSSHWKVMSLEVLLSSQLAANIYKKIACRILLIKPFFFSLLCLRYIWQFGNNSYFSLYDHFIRNSLKYSNNGSSHFPLSTRDGQKSSCKGWWKERPVCHSKHGGDLRLHQEHAQAHLWNGIPEVWPLGTQRDLDFYYKDDA